MDLLDDIRAARETARIALFPRPGFADPTGLGTGIGTEGMMAASAIQEQIVSMIRQTPDADLLTACQRPYEEPGKPEADALGSIRLPFRRYGRGFASWRIAPSNRGIKHLALLWQVEGTEWNRC